MRIAILAAVAVSTLAAQPHLDNVLVRMVPQGTTALAGAQIQALLTTPAYRGLIEKQASAWFDKFTTETGFDPRRDVREILFASVPEGGVLLARGHFDPKPQAFEQATLVRHGIYTIRAQGDNGLCILDSSLAAAGKLPALKAALDEWNQKGQHAAAQPLLNRIRQVGPAAQLWAVSDGVAGLLSSARLPGPGSGFDISQIFRGLTDTWLEASLASGLKFEAHGMAGVTKDAMVLRDAAKGVVGFGRLSVPENQPEMLPVFDGITVEQQDRSIAIRIDLAQKTVDSLIALISTFTRK